MRGYRWIALGLAGVSVACRGEEARIGACKTGMKTPGGISKPARARMAVPTPNARNISSQQARQLGAQIATLVHQPICLRAQVEAAPPRVKRK